MAKKNRNTFSDITYDELTDFIKPINNNIEVPLNEIGNFYNWQFQPMQEAKKNIMSKYSDILINMPVLSRKLTDRSLNRVLCITYNSHTSGYDFRLNPIDIFNNIFKCLELDYEIPFINLDNEYGMAYLKDYVRSFINDIRRTKFDSDIITITSELNHNLNDICNLYYENINEIIEKNAIPKDVLFYLSFRSLMLRYETGNEKYNILPYEYYKEISHMRTTPYPHKISVTQFNVRVWFDSFRHHYEEIIGKDYIPDVNKYLLSDSEVLLAWDILRPGMVERELRDVMARHRANPNVDYAKYQKLFELKMNYFMNSPYKKYILGKYGLLGYMGFSYDNEYLVFDKFHNSETIDPAKKTILTHGEAIYALPSDRFTLVRGTKQGIIKAKETDDRIKKINHTSNESFIKRLDNVIYGPNLSIEKFDDILEEEKKKILIKKI